jgi:REP element-mobilizing transposase RayT
LLDLIRRLSSFYFVDVLGFCVMSNHFHLVVRMHPSDHLSDDAMRERLEKKEAHGDRLSALD